MIFPSEPFLGNLDHSRFSDECELPEILTDKLVQLCIASGLPAVILMASGELKLFFCQIQFITMSRSTALKILE